MSPTPFDCRAPNDLVMSLAGPRTVGNSRTEQCLTRFLVSTGDNQYIRERERERDPCKIINSVTYRVDCWVIPASRDKKVNRGWTGGMINEEK